MMTYSEHELEFTFAKNGGPNSVPRKTHEQSRNYVIISLILPQNDRKHEDKKLE